MKAEICQLQNEESTEENQKYMSEVKAGKCKQERFLPLNCRWVKILCIMNSALSTLSQKWSKVWHKLRLPN